MARTGPKFSKTEHEEVLQRVARLDRMGWSQSAIAREVDVTQPQVASYLKKIRRRYLTSMLTDHATMVAEMEEKYRDIAREAWAAYERSKEDASKEVREYVKPYVRRKQGEGEDPPPDEPMKLMKRIRTKEGRLPGSEYLNIVKSCCEAIRQLRGLDAPKKVQVEAQVINWDVLAQEAPTGTVLSVEKQIEEFLANPVTPALSPPDASVEPSAVPEARERSEVPNALHELPPDSSPPSTNGHS